MKTKTSALFFGLLYLIAMHDDVTFFTKASEVLLHAILMFKEILHENILV